MVVLSSKEILQAALEIEEKSRIFYESFSKDENRENIKKVFEYLAKEEKKHLDEFQRLAGVFADSTEVSEQETQTVYLERLLSNLEFNKLEDKMKKVTSDIESVDLAIRLEKDTILFYIELSAFVSPDGLKVISQIMNKEKEHLLTLFNLKHTLVDFANDRETDRLNRLGDDLGINLPK
jgi:rubrerythrin